MSRVPRALQQLLSIPGTAKSVGETAKSHISADSSRRLSVRGSEVKPGSEGTPPEEMADAAASSFVCEEDEDFDDTEVTWVGVSADGCVLASAAGSIVSVWCSNRERGG